MIVKALFARDFKSFMGYIFCFVSGCDLTAVGLGVLQIRRTCPPTNTCHTCERAC